MKRGQRQHISDDQTGTGKRLEYPKWVIMLGCFEAGLATGTLLAMLLLGH